MSDGGWAQLASRSICLRYLEGALECSFWRMCRSVERQMASTNKAQRQHDLPASNASMQLVPQMAAQLTRDLCAAWDAIQPMEQSWGSLLAGRDSTGAALKNLNELARPAFAETEAQRQVLLRMRLLLDALGLRDMSKH